MGVSRPILLFILMLKEGVVNITPEEENAIDGMLGELEEFHKKNASDNIDRSNNAICYTLKQHVNEELAPKYNLTEVKWSFVYEPSSNIKAGYKPVDKVLFVNLAYSVRKMADGLSHQPLDFTLVAGSIYHEWVHVKQVSLYKNHTSKDIIPSLMKIYSNTSYDDIRWEQMAIARQELDWIKRRLKKHDLTSVIEQLKKWGLMHTPAVIKLRRINPKAYKGILKYAVMFILKKQAQKAIMSK